MKDPEKIVAGFIGDTEETVQENAGLWSCQTGDWSILVGITAAPFASGASLSASSSC